MEIKALAEIKAFTVARPSPDELRKHQMYAFERDEAFIPARNDEGAISNFHDASWDISQGYSVDVDSIYSIAYIWPERVGVGKLVGRRTSST